jgi:hypothetical protein
MLALVYFAGVAVVLVVVLGLFLNSLWHDDIPFRFRPITEGLISCLVLAWGWPFFLLMVICLAWGDYHYLRRVQETIYSEEGETHR